MSKPKSKSKPHRHGHGDSRPRRPARWLSALLLLALAWVTPAGIPSSSLAATAPPPSPLTPPARVLTSFLPVFSWTTSVAGDRARVENWLPAGVDPHDFQYSPRDLRRLREANALIVIGMGLENWREANLRALSSNPKLRLFEAAHGLTADQVIYEDCGHDHSHDQEHEPNSAATATPEHRVPNPHFWLDPVLARHAVTNILAALVEVDPGGGEVYRSNATRLTDTLAQLHQEYATALAPLRHTPFITLHNAFPYLARRYQLSLVGVLESTGTEDPSARELATLSATVRREGVRVLFVDGRSSRLARRFAADLGLEIATLETLETGTLTPQAYVDGMRRNLDTLRRSLAPRPSR